MKDQTTVSTTQDKPAYYSAKQVAQRLNLSPRTIRRMSATGRFLKPCITIGTILRWNRVKVWQWEGEQQHPQQHATHPTAEGA